MPTLTYTPGPWEVIKQRVNVEGTYTAIRTIIKAQGVLIAECHEDNANLIAAAPELLEMLEQLMPYVALGLKAGAFKHCAAGELYPSRLLDKAQKLKNKVRGFLPIEAQNT